MSAGEVDATLDWTALEARLGYAFKDRRHLLNALTHRSWMNERPRSGPADDALDNNERLEFLGDAIVGLTASRLLFSRYPDAREGELTRRRADLVCEGSLERAARTLDLGPFLRLSRGEEKSGGRDKPRLLASALEAVVAAVYLDGGVAAAEGVAEGLLNALLITMSDDVPGQSDFKSALQELLQSRGESLPVYEIENAEGPEHERVFFVEVRAQHAENGDVRAQGKGRTKSAAEQNAAENLLSILRA